jgi:hypothetical protein
MNRSGGTSKRVATEAAELLRASASKKVRSVAGVIWLNVVGIAVLLGAARGVQ